MTHEEVMTEIARKELRSYKQLPQIWYQIQTEVSRRAPAQVRIAARAPVHDEGLVLVRHRRRRTRRFAIRNIMTFTAASSTAAG